MSLVLKFTAFYLSSALPAFSVSPVAAQQLSPDWTPCVNQGNAFTPDVQIGGCTTVLQSSRETAAYRAIAYCNGGHAYATMEDYDRAIADYSEAIRLNPCFAGAYNNWAWAYFMKRLGIVHLREGDGCLA
jgi:tetratricopeptide (TPR) repeat protein